MAFCSNCGNEMQDGEKFCPVCGEETLANAGKSEKCKHEHNKIEELEGSEAIGNALYKAKKICKWYVFNWKRLTNEDWRGLSLNHHLAWIGIHVAPFLLLLFVLAGSKVISNGNRIREASRMVVDSEEDIDMEVNQSGTSSKAEYGDSVKTETDSVHHETKSSDKTGETSQKKTKEAIGFESLAGVWATSTNGTGMSQGDMVGSGGSRNKEKALYIMGDGNVYTYNIYVWDLAYCKYKWAGDNTVSIELGAPYTSVPVDLTYELVGEELYISIGSTSCWMKKLGDDSQLFYDFVYANGY